MEKLFHSIFFTISIFKNYVHKVASVFKNLDRIRLPKAIKQVSLAVFHVLWWQSSEMARYL